jgi:plasmid stabilization system protein ParE
MLRGASDRAAERCCGERRPQMPKGAYTAKQERKAEHIEQSYEKRGVSKKEAEERAWRTVNKQDKGGKNDGSGRSRSRSEAAKKGWETRRRRRGT